MADVPIEVVVPVATLAVATIGTLFGMLMKSKNDQIKIYRSSYHRVVYSRRRMRRDMEEATLGTPSVPPPPEKDAYDDRSDIVEAIALEDDGWRPKERIRIEPVEDNLTREERTKLERERHLRRYVSEGDDTPPGKEGGYRPKMKSRPR